MNNSPAKHMHVLTFTFDINDYWLQFKENRPNVGMSALINRYMLVFNILIPDPWLDLDDNIVPFLNTYSYNLNDVKFYF